MSVLQFTKMHGCANDYIYINCFEAQQQLPDIGSEQFSQLVRRLSDRHTGIGADGVVLILPSRCADVRMRMFNADGSEAEMCGNASRCVGKYMYEHHLTTRTDLTMQTQAGLKQLTLHLQNSSEVDSVTVNMGVAQVGQTLYLQGQELIPVSIGNPHAVCFTNDLSTTNVHSLGASLEVDTAFPNKTNVEFAQVLNYNEIRLRVWERGTGETMACGTGACATVAAAIAQQRTQNEVCVHLLGGDLHIRQDAHTQELYMTGTAIEVFTGQILL